MTDDINGINKANHDAIFNKGQKVGYRHGLGVAMLLSKDDDLQDKLQEEIEKNI